jgi:murein DD-endopeptidase MepM/ murein hydrolase activator NlpD
MKRPLLLVVVAALIAVAPATADLGDEKATIDSKISTLHDRIDAARERESSLTAEIAATSERIRALETRAGDVSRKMGTLQQELALRRTRLDQLEALYALQTRRLRSLRRQQALAVARVNARLIDIYESPDPSLADVMLSAHSIDDLLDKVEYANAIALQDRSIAAAVTRAKRQLAGARSQTRTLRAAAASESRVIAYRLEQMTALRSTLASTAAELDVRRSQSQDALAAAQESERAWREEADALRSASADLAAKIEAASAPPAAPTESGTPSSPPPPTEKPGGLIWPIRGTITSPFGMRWGSLHPGLDIADPTGTPIAAAASGRVIIAGWEGGYGNLVVLENGGGIATAYAHQSSIAVTVGQTVSQGQTIGYVGSTGFSTGPHLHFEVRVNGSPVDPVGYL